MVEASSPQSHMERLAPLLVIVSQLSLTSAYCRPASRHSDRHLHDCPLDALRCILFEACTVCLSLWLIIEPREAGAGRRGPCPGEGGRPGDAEAQAAKRGLSEPPQVYLWRQHQSNWGCCYTRLPHVAPGVENYRVALPSLRETARVAAVCRRWGGIIGAWASRRRFVTSTSTFASTQRVVPVVRVNCTHLKLQLHVTDLMDLGVARMRNNAILSSSSSQARTPVTGQVEEDS